jgi:hypothetical protein
MPKKTIINLRALAFKRKKRYKFRIRKLYDNLSGKKKRSFNIALQVNNISRTAFHSYCHITLDSKQDIPCGKLDVIAVLLDSTPDNLKNYVVKKSHDNDYEIIHVKK